MILKLLLIIFIAFIFKTGLINKIGTNTKFNSKNIYVHNITDNKEVFKLRASEKVSPASLTKLMTVYTALNKI